MGHKRKRATGPLTTRLDDTKKEKFRRICVDHGVSLQDAVEHLIDAVIAKRIQWIYLGKSRRKIRKDTLEV